MLWWPVSLQQLHQEQHQPHLQVIRDLRGLHRVSDHYITLSYLVRGLSLVLKKKEKQLDWAGQTRYTPLVEVNQAIISLVLLDKYSL